MATNLIKPIITEKMTAMAAKQRYGFRVDKRANKLEIKTAIESMYGVSITDVNTMNYIGKKSVRYTKRGFSSGRKNAFKKAIVTLKDGETIDFFSNI
ncbi:MAG: 50S ribosomal protein L23 [Flavobacteriales bacterium]|nr:50S ribosomal protein L23 [Flavobacteriales bacterium]MCZ2443602.1 50S ribosomal protein L23 [Flavobacteriales bacterium]